MDALFLRQVWAGNDAMLQDLAQHGRPARRPARLAHRRGAPALLPDQQGPVGSARSQPAVRPRRAGQAGGGELLSRRARPRRTSRSGSTACRAPRRRPPPASSRPSAAATRASSPCPTASNTRASWRAPPSCCARRRSSPSNADAEEVPDRARRRVPHRTTTTRATSRGWSSTPPIEPTIGPYEVYEDEWFNAKAAFEAFITVRDEAESKKLQAFSEHLQELENNLPIDPKYRNPKLGALAPIRVVNVVFAAGDAQPRRPDRRLQPAQRRARRQGEGHQARDAQERAGREVQDGAAADLEDRAAGRRPGEDLVRRVLHAHPDARADARPRPAQHHRRRPRRRRSGRS